MKSAAAIITTGLLASATAAHQHAHRDAHRRALEKRALVVETVWQTAWVTEIVEDSTTVWVYPSKPAATTPTTSSSRTTSSSSSSFSSSSSSSSSSTSQSAAQFFQPESTTFATSTSAPVAAQISIQQTPVVVNTPTPSVAQAETPVNTPAPVVPSSSSAAAAAPAATSSAASSSGSGSSSGSSSGTNYSGQITWYDLGTGSCGQSYAGQDESAYVVALSHVIMTPLNGANPNNNPMCGRKILIGGKVTATVIDTCEGCAEGDIDVSKIAFTSAAGALGLGRVQTDWVLLDA